MRFGFGKRQRWDLEVDVLALGSGLAGVTAAIVAHARGRKVAILDKSPKLGGVCGLPECSLSRIALPTRDRPNADCTDRIAYAVVWISGSLSALRLAYA